MLAVQGVCAAYAFRLDRERPAPLLTLPLQQLVYRQLMYLVLMQSVDHRADRRPAAWQKLRRTGQLEAAPRTAQAAATRTRRSGVRPRGRQRDTRE